MRVLSYVAGSRPYSKASSFLKWRTLMSIFGNSSAGHILLAGSRGGPPLSPPPPPPPVPRTPTGSILASSNKSD